MRDSVVFYRSFAEAIKALPEEEQLFALWAVINYGLNETVPDSGGVATAIYMMAKPQIDANNKRYLNGTKGGRPKTEPEPKNNLSGTKSKPSNNQTQTKSEPKEKENVNVKEKDNKNTMCNADANALFERLWKAYPNKRGKGQVSDAKKCKLAEIGEEHMLRAMTRYIEDLKQDDWRKPQNGSTFFNSSYVDYLDENYVPPEKIPAKKNGFNNFEQRGYDYNDLQKKLLERSMGNADQ